MTGRNTATGNPYASYGTPVAGAEFVGRADHIRSIRNRIFTAPEAAPVSIVGPPRVGKSSLARQVLDQFAIGASPSGLTFVPVWITVSGAVSEQSLFRELALLILDQLDECGLPADRLQAPYAALTAAVGWDQMCMCLKTFLRQVRRAGYQVVAVLDEFDAARTVFHRAAPFQYLRAIAYDPKVGVALITASRRPLSEIVVKSTAEVSNFPQIFGSPLTLGCFDGPELSALIARSPFDNDLRDALFGWLDVETGGQPFLASALLSALHERWMADGLPDRGELDRQFKDAVAACGQLAVDYYETTLELLREENRLGKLLEVLFGPQETVTPPDAERMAREGIIKQTPDGWAAFSESFSQYLLLLEDTRTSDDWRLWHRTETGLRAALSSALEHAYGGTWPITLAESQKKLVVDCQTRQDRDRAFGDTVSDDGLLLEYAYPKDLLAIMMRHWAQVEPVFGHGKEEWRQKIELIAKVRTPMAHNRRAGTSPALMKQFRETCREILGWLPAAAGESP